MQGQVKNNCTQKKREREKESRCYYSRSESRILKVGLFYLPNSGCGFSNSKGYIYIFFNNYHIFLSSRDTSLAWVKRY